MPNWCTTDMVITNSDADAIRRLASEFDNAFHWEKIKNGFSAKWLGSILGYLGYKEQDILHGDVRCRGGVTGFDFRDNKIYLSTETAWTPMFEPIQKMIDKYAPESEITYYAVEEECQIHSTNDYNIVGKIYVDWCESVPKQLSWLEEATGEYMDKNEFLRAIAESMEWGNLSVSEIESEIEEKLSDSFGYSQWEFAEIDVWK